MDDDYKRLVEECTSTIQSVPFQVFLILQCLATVLSFFTTYRFLKSHIRNSSIHMNFKFLLSVYFTKCYLSGSVFLLNASSFFYRMLTFNGHLEDSQMDPMLFRCLHLAFATVLLMDVTTKVIYKSYKESYTHRGLQLLLVVERTMATGKVEKYEKETSRRACWAYLVFILAFPCSVICIVYRNASFKDPSCFGLFAPEEMQSSINVLFTVATMLSILSFLFLRFIILLNTKKWKIHRLRLSTRYQISENLACSHLVSTVLLTGLCVSIFFGVSLMTLRTANFEIFKNNRALFNTTKLAVYPLSLADFLIPIYAGSRMRKTKNAKMASLNWAISTGNNTKKATDTYEMIFQAQWK